MCNSHATARFQCQRLYGDINACAPDFNDDGHYYHSVTGLRWEIHPDDDAGVGVTGVAPDAKPLCVLYAELLEREKSDPPAPKTQRPPHIQRLKSRNRDNQVRFMERFEFDYMGNSYFETGEAGKRIRELEELHGFGECVIDGFKINFIYDPRNYNEAGAAETIGQIFNRKQDWWIEEDPYFDTKNVSANVKALKDRKGWAAMRVGAYHSREPEGLYGVPRPARAYDAWLDIRFGLFWTIDHKANIADVIKNFKKSVEHNIAKAAEERARRKA